MDTKTLGKWLYIIGLVVTILAALFGYAAEWLTLVLMIMGILVGLIAISMFLPLFDLTAMTQGGG